ncbi:MAG: malto-oligosyltrehalose trehalohydrolase [Ignavibacteriaceae bacterium]
MKVGTYLLENGEYEFKIWAPKVEELALKIISPREKLINLEKDEFDYWKTRVKDIAPGTRYLYRINNSDDKPDPASNYQPDGVHAASEVVNHSLFNWTDKSWKGLELKDYIIYEIHTGTFTREGTFESIIPKLEYLKELGITAIELMPVAQFPGSRNWGYDGVYHYAPQNSYGGPDGLKKIIDSCHNLDIAVILDVVYNHFGPEGNYTGKFASYFNPFYHSPWGDAVNFDGAYSEPVRNYFVENALYWFSNFHIDALRLDAIDRIIDMSARHLLLEIAEKTRKLSNELGRKFHLIAESDLNDNKIIRPDSEHGFGIDAQWSDDFHHSLHSLLTGEKQGYYQDFGSTGDLIKSIRDTFVYSGQYSRYRKRRHGNSALQMKPDQFVINIQNHDQVGNRAMGERLAQLISFEEAKLAAAALIISPYIPLIFMGQEYNEENPFLYFVSFNDKNLIEAVRKGRREEFLSFNWIDEVSDPQSEQTFISSKLNWELVNEGQHKILLNFYKYLIKIRKINKAFFSFDRKNFEIIGNEKDKIVILSRWWKENKITSIINFNNEAVTALIPFSGGKWRKILDSADIVWDGTGTSTPDKLLGKEQNITIKKSSISVYELE